MDVATLLAQAAQCKSDDDAASLLDALEEAFGNSKSLGQCASMNSESYMEGEQPFVRFELNHLISDHYITMMRPEIRNGEFVVVVVTNRMLDGLGIHSKSWEVHRDMETVIEAEPTQTVDDLATKAREQAIENHAALIEEVGVKSEAALAAAKASW